MGCLKSTGGSHQLHTGDGTPQPFGDSHGSHILRRGPASGSVKEAPEPGRTGVWAGWQCKGCGHSQWQAQLSMQSSWVSREERWSSAQPAEPPSRESCLGTGNRVPAGLHTGALQIHGGSSTKAGPVLQCWAAGQGRLLRAMPSTAAGISPGPTDGYEEQSLGWCFFPRHKSLFKNCLVPGQGPCGMWEGHGHAEPAQEMSPVARGAEPGWSVGPG